MISNINAATLVRISGYSEERVKLIIQSEKTHRHDKTSCVNQYKNQTPSSL